MNDQQEEDVFIVQEKHPAATWSLRGRMFEVQEDALDFGRELADSHRRHRSRQEVRVVLLRVLAHHEPGAATPPPPVAFRGAR